MNLELAGGRGILGAKRWSAQQLCYFVASFVSEYFNSNFSFLLLPLVPELCSLAIVRVVQIYIQFQHSSVSGRDLHCGGSEWCSHIITHCSTRKDERGFPPQVSAKLIFTTVSSSSCLGPPQPLFSAPFISCH